MSSAGSTAWADVQSFQGNLAGTTLGIVGYEADDAGQATALHGRFDNTPFGVFNGTFERTSRPAQTEAGGAVIQYLGVTGSTRKSRTVSVLHAAGRAIETTVRPESEATQLSQVAAVPPGIIGPVEAFGRLVGAGGCPGPFRIYDGRRVVDVAVRSSEPNGDSLTCHTSYEVVAWPGHVSPLGFTSLSLDLSYGASDAGIVLTEVDISAGPFALRLVRQAA